MVIGRRRGGSMRLANSSVVGTVPLVLHFVRSAFIFLGTCARSAGLCLCCEGKGTRLSHDYVATIGVSVFSSL